MWQQKAHLIRAYLDLHPKAAKLSEEIAYILEQGVKKAGIEYAAVTYRAKSLESFCEKVVRKSTKDPIKEITDLAGVRIVYLYNSDLKKLESLIEKQFTVVEKVDKVDRAEPDHFGYGALHYLVRLGKHSLGARYDDLKELVCEIQVQTILQDAWAIVAHHLSYKQEADVPKKLRRKLNALSGLFETADDQFNRLRDEREEYRAGIKQQISDEAPTFLQQDINLDNLSEYLKWRMPDRAQLGLSDVADLLEELQRFGYKKIEQLERALYLGFEALTAYEKEYPPSDDETYEPCQYAAVGVIRGVLELTDDNYLSNKVSSEEMQDRIKRFRTYLKKE
jgi:ppGpp synthetase/RelA/SpoT-type nucleotidyltranferase